MTAGLPKWTEQISVEVYRPESVGTVDLSFCLPSTGETHFFTGANAMTTRSHSRRMKDWAARGLGVIVFLFFLGVVFSPFRFSAAPVDAQTSTFLYVNPPSQNAMLGGTASVDVIIQNVANLYGAEIDLAFDPTRLMVRGAVPNQPGTQIDPGPLLTSGDYFVAVNRVDNTAGTIMLALTQLNPTPPVTGSGSVAHINFQTRAAGIAPVRLTSAMLSDRNGIKILYVTNNPPSAPTRSRSALNSVIQDGAISITSGANLVFVPLVVR